MEVANKYKGLIGSWDFNLKNLNKGDDKGDVFYPFNGNTNDYHGNYNATNSGATLTTDKLGNENNAYYFDGSSNYMYLDSTLDLGTTHSIAFRVNLTKVVAMVVSGAYNLSHCYFITSTLFSYRCGGYGESYESSSFTIPTITVNGSTYYDFVVTRDDNSVKLYMDGIFISGNTLTNNYKYYIDQIGIESTWWLGGTVDYIKVFENRVLLENDALILHKKNGNLPTQIGNKSNNDNKLTIENIDLSINRYGEDNKSFYFTNKGDIRCVATFDPQVFNIVDGDCAFSFWMKIDTLDISLRVILGHNLHFASIIHISHTSLTLIVESDTNGDYSNTWLTVPDTEWHHYVLSWKGGLYSAWLDNEKKQTDYNTVFNNVLTLSSIGGHTQYSHSSLTLDGVLDDVRLYQKSLTDSDVKKLYETRL